MDRRIFKKLTCILLCTCLLLSMFPVAPLHAAQSIEIVTALRGHTELSQRAEALSNELSLLPTTGNNRNGRVRLSDFIQSADGSKDMKDLKGKHYLIRNQDSIFYALDGSWTGTDANLPLKQVTASDTSNFYYITAGISTSMAFDLHYTGNASNGMPGYVLRFNNGRNLAVGSRYTGSYTNLYYVKADTTADLSKAPKIRFVHPDGSGWARISNFNGTHGLRQSNDLTHVRWKDNSAGDNAYDGNALYLYRLWSTAGLRETMAKMQSYLEVPELYEEAEYAQFLTCMEESIAMFKKYDARPTSLVAPYDFIQDTLDTQAKTLNAYATKLIPRTDLTPAQTAAVLRRDINTLPATGTNRNGRVLLSSFTQSSDGSTDMKDLRGKHYLIRFQSPNFYALDGSWTGTDANLPLKQVTASDTSNFYYITAGISTSMAFDLHYTGNASNGMPAYVLRFHNGKNLAVGSQYTGTYTNLYYVKADTTANLSTAPKIRFEHPDGVGWVRIRNASGTHGLRQSSDLTHVRWKDNSAGDNAYDGNALYLYRLWSTHSILSAIRDMTGYLDTPEFFEPETYSAFLACMEESIALFRQYDVVPKAGIQPYDFIQERLDEKAAELRAFDKTLTDSIPRPPATETNAVTTLHQLPSKAPRSAGDYDHNMSYVIVTRQGKIILIDGGWERNNEDGDFLFSYLQKITGDPTPNIEAWFITHAHGDHHGAVATFANKYADKVTVEAFYHHYPNESDIRTYLASAGIDGTISAVGRVPYMMKKLKNVQGGPVREVFVNSVHSGKCNSSFDFDEVHIDILLDFEDIKWAVNNVSGTYSGTWPVEGRNFKNLTFRQLVDGNFNETSIVFRASVGGKNILFTGDAGYVAGYLLNKFHDIHASNPDQYYTIKSDYVQVAHHGYYGLTKATYNRIDPDVGLWPTPKYEYTGSKSDLALPYALEWFAEMGVTNYPSYLGPQSFSFPVVRSASPISIPAELKDYVFDAQYYLSQYPELFELYGNDQGQLYYHFVNYGIEEGRCASPFFDVRFYANQNGQNFRDAHKGNYLAAFNDFLSKYKTPSPMKLSPIFDTAIYAAAHSDMSNTSMLGLLQHYAAEGYGNGEIPSQTFLSSDGTTVHTDCAVTTGTVPTCTQAGKSYSVKCNTCSAVVVPGTAIPAKGHTPVTVPGTPAGCTTTGMTEGSYCADCREILAQQEEIPATGHSYTYKTVDGATHGVTCTKCDYTATEAHTYEDGNCICGESEIKEPVIDECLVINHTLNLASDISVNFAVRAELLEGYNTHCMVCEIPVYEGNVQTGTKTITLAPSLNGYFYYYTLTGLTAIQMGDVVTAQLRMEKDGGEYCSKVDTYSVAQYAYTQLNKEGADPKLKALCAELLRYGSAAQIFKGYRTDALADGSMTEAQRAYLADLSAVTFGNTNRQHADLSNPTAKWLGKSLILDSKVTLRYVVDLTACETTDNITLRVRYRDYAGAEQTAVLTEAEPYGSVDGYYSFDFSGLLAAELRTVLQAAVYAGDTQISNTLEYSVDTYGNNKTGTLDTLCRALMAYSDAAKTFFAK